MAPPQPMQCSSGSCEYETPVNIPTYELVLKALELHVQSVHTRNNASHGQSKVEKPKRPTVSTGFSESDWQFFVHKWERYSRQTQIQESQLTDELWSCMDDELEKLAFSDGCSGLNSETLLNRIKLLAVTTLHPSVHVVNLHQMKQNTGESTKSFSARVKGVAGNCNLSKECSNIGCTENISYLEETCYHVVMSGISNQELREKVLTQAMLGVVKDLPTLLSFTSAEESARMKDSIHGVAAVQEKKQQNRKCYSCGQQQHGFNNKNRASQCFAYGKICVKCKKPNHLQSVCKSGKAAAISPQTQASDQTDEEASVSGFIAAISNGLTSSSYVAASETVKHARTKTNLPVTTLPIPHYVFDDLQKRWKRQAPQSSPTLVVTAALDKAAYRELNLNLPDLVKKPGAGYARARTATADSGAQLTVINIQELTALGVKPNSIFPLATSVNTVTKTTVDLVGGIFLIFSASNTETGVVKKTRQLCYVSKSVLGIYLSQEACSTLGCLPTDFPKVGVCAEMSAMPEKNKSCVNLGVPDKETVTCPCPKRTLPPSDEPILPCEPTKENLPVLKDYILKRYESSAFNCCEHQALPLVDSSIPLRLFVDAQASPVAVSTPSPIPFHWNDQVKQGLDRDEQLGVF